MRDVTKQSELVPDLRDGGDSCRAHGTAREAGIPSEFIDDYRRALQALCDVRHMLPPDGVAIVDVVLEGQSCQWTHDRRSERRAALLESAQYQEVNFEYDSEQLNIEQESKLSERIFLN